MSPDQKTISEFKARVEELIMLEAERLWKTPAPDFASYNQRVGYIRGLREQIAVLDEIEHPAPAKKDQGLGSNPLSKIYEL